MRLDTVQPPTHSCTRKTVRLVSSRPPRDVGGHATGAGQSHKHATRLDEKTDAALVARARREHKSVSAVIRDVLRTELAKS